MKLSVNTHLPEETIALGARLGSLLRGGDVLLLSGDLGAGKTRLSKGVAQGLGVIDEVTSPTFNLVLEYTPTSLASKEAKVHTLRHFDLYRLEDEAQLDDIDYFGLIEDDTAVSVVEWGTQFSSALPLDYLSVEMFVVDDAEAGNTRQLDFTARGKRAEALLEEFIALEGAVLHDKG